jgi:uncharacterized repeat protein (TIGR01451 family)
VRKRLIIAALAAMALVVAAGSALAANGKSVIFDSTNPNGPKTNLPSYGPTAYSFTTIGDKIALEGTARSLNSVTVTLSSWACQQGSWNGKDCVTQPGATFAQEMMLKIYDASDLTTPIATSTQSFDVPYRPSASPKCTATDAGKWMSTKEGCKNGLANDVTFNFSNVKLPDTVVYAISYNTGGPADSLNVAVTDAAPSAGASTDTNIWIDGAENAGFGTYTPAVQFKAGNGS